MNDTVKIPYIFGKRTEAYRKIDSTQKRIKEIFKMGPSEAVVFSENQTHGYGRRGRKWESPPGGLYFSVLIKYHGNRELLSMSALLAAMRAFREQDDKIKWKWPNDLIYEGKKLGGIFTEVLSDEWAGFGIGINTGVDRDAFIEYMRENAAVCNIDKNKFVEKFITLLEQNIKKKFISDNDLEYLNNNHDLNEESVSINNAAGKVLGIDERGRLEVLTADKKIEKIIHGTITIIKQTFYPRGTILAVDIGNTTTKIGKIQSEGIIKSSVIPTNPHENYTDRLLRIIERISGTDINSLRGIAVSCVVTGIEKRVIKTLKSEISDKIINVTDKSKISLSLKVKNPAQVGADRICNAAAAYHIYGGNAVVVDLGTANTFDVISDKGEYLGGVIAPGIDSMQEVLCEKADKLYKYKFSLPEKAIGDETSACLNIGLYYTLKGQIGSILEAIKKEWKREYKVIITGGGIEKLDKEFIEDFIIDNDITLKGLAVIWKNEIES